jgi:hypothetical protein
MHHCHQEYTSSLARTTGRYTLKGCTGRTLRKRACATLLIAAAASRKWKKSPWGLLSEGILAASAEAVIGPPLLPLLLPLVVGELPAVLHK